MANVMRYKNALKEELIVRAVASIYDMNIIHPVNFHIMKNAIELARSHDITVYDSTYLSFALNSGSFLITSDKKLQKKISDMPGVIDLGEYDSYKDGD
jgi:predicted nucleic acid-binding protein